MPRTKSSRTTRTKRTTKKKGETRKLPNLSNITLTKSYTSLAYGVLTVIVLFFLIYAGIRIFSHRAGTISNEGVNTESTQKTAQNSQKNQYVVKEGDNLWSISQQEYGTGYNWQLIAKANNLTNPGQIDKGQKLTIPEAPKATPSVTASVSPTVTSTPTATATPTPSKAPQVANVNGVPQGAINGESYTVQRGDYLWEIAVRAYGDGYRWVDIARANNLANPGLIFSGNVLTLPRP
jgi:nucleoid-associated protein YgaU